MKKILLAALILLTPNLFADDQPNYAPIMWLSISKANVNSENIESDIYGRQGGPDKNFKQHIGFGLSNRIYLSMLNVHVDIGGYMTGKLSHGNNMVKWTGEINVIKNIWQEHSIYAFGGLNYTEWTMQDYDNTSGGIGGQIGFGRTMLIDDRDRLLIELGLTRFGGTANDIGVFEDDGTPYRRDFNMHSYSLFLKVGILMGM